MLILSVCLWVACGVYAYGKMYRHMQETFPLIAREGERSDFVFSAGLAVWGPLAVIAFYLSRWIHNDPHHGFQFFRNKYD